jgi:hypothetical protein
MKYEARTVIENPQPSKRCQQKDLLDINGHVENVLAIYGGTKRPPQHD